MNPSNRYTYENAGFNGFLLRSLKSNNLAQTLNDGISVGSGKPINFDIQQISGNIGDQLRVGRLNLNGAKGRMESENEQGVETGWFGDITP